MDEYAMLDNIKAHSIVVARVAEVVARGMVDAGASLSLDLVIAASLLHDIAKTRCLRTKEDHSRVGREICLKHSFHDVAEIVGEHVILKNGVPGAGVTEKEIVYYSDKRVNHDRIVALDDRLAYILDRYGRNDEKRHAAILMNFNTCKELEKKIFSRLGFPPLHLAAELKSFIPFSNLSPSCLGARHP